MAVKTRRRGKELEKAVYDAALAELKAMGYGGLSMAGVAARARCGKGSLYRRWPTKRDVILDALRARAALPPSVRQEGPARRNLVTVLHWFAQLLVGKTGYPELVVIAELFGDDEIRETYADLVLVPVAKAIQGIIAAGLISGEIDPTAVRDLTIHVGPALIIQSVLLTGTTPRRAELEQISDAILG
ncbi:hypothetical protein K883_05185 [Mycobacterium sp. TKK-01-0059]|uniref:TetR/AcrR family transcriptional regulator n=1 Tax=Mycobacterium sp. TKK-01-0059 TaxID=1324269 RepID=UPI0004DAE626|nr:TetR/AcrR family transcriptional regulator [Mycobacterium sp. TKK-01-0059]KEF95000.1 hypothetical protein K883_05185 [Mycobacterium sp. TKK-01-0059]